MQGVSALNLEPHEYAIVPAEEIRDIGGQLSTAVSGGESHLHNVERTDGTRVLEVVKRMGAQSQEGLIRSIETEYLFRPPAGDSLLSLKRARFRHSYTLRDATNDAVLATWRKGLYVVGNWKVKDTAGEVRAIVKSDSFLSTITQHFVHPTYTVYSPDGNEIAQFDHVRTDGTLVNKMLSKLEVTVESSSVPPEILLGVAYAMFYPF